MTLLIGCDPELFLKNPNNGQFFSADGLIPGSKELPYRVMDGAVQVDGLAAEFNIDPAENCDQFVRRVTSVMGQLGTFAPGYTLAIEPFAEFEQHYYHSEVPDHAKELGCNPDYNAWTGSVNPMPPGADKPFRTASGHIHIGWTTGAEPFETDHYEKCCEFVKQLDYYLGVPSLKWDPDNRRRTMYGQAGAFRPKSYGVEYRVLSNRWLASPMLMRWVYYATKRAFEDFEAGHRAVDLYGDVAREIINESDIDYTKYVDIDLGLAPIPKVAA